VTLIEKQAAWRERYLLIPDAQDRLSAIVSRKSKLEPLRADERIDANLVPGCVSRVWLSVDGTDGRIHVRTDGEAALVKGLAAFLGEFYDGARPEEVGAFELTLLEDLGIQRLLSPTRAQGLRQVAARIRALSAGR
jgi:cysteine desulfuration protein SufE